MWRKICIFRKYMHCIDIWKSSKWPMSLLPSLRTLWPSNLVQKFVSSPRADTVFLNPNLDKAIKAYHPADFSIFLFWVEFFWQNRWNQRGGEINQPSLIFESLIYLSLYWERYKNIKTTNYLFQYILNFIALVYALKWIVPFKSFMPCFLLLKFLL